MTIASPRPIRGFAGEVLDAGRRRVTTRPAGVHNAAIDRRPALIARCAGPHDVAAALRHARLHGLPVTVRGGGHAAGGFALADDALTIDLRAMRAVAVDPARRRAARAGRRDVARARRRDAGATGSRSPARGCRRSASPGFTLGSGSGWLERKLGPSGRLAALARASSPPTATS